MPFPPPSLVLSAAAAIEGIHPLAVVTVPALLRQAAALDIDPTTSAVPFGSGNELRLLDDFFTLPRPPDPDRPFRAPWSSAEAWQKRKYPGGGLQRLRTDWSGKGRLLKQQKAVPTDLWSLTPDAGSELQELSSGRSVRLVDLALWFGREQDVTDLDALLEWFRAEFEPNRGDLIGTIYSEDVPADYRTVPFADQPIGEDTQRQLGSMPPAPTVELSLADLTGRIEKRVSAGGFQLPSGLVRRVLAAWLCGEIVVLVGQPGTGKTMFATLLGQALQAELDLDTPLVIPVRPDFDEAELIGYERLDGTLEIRDFAREVLMADDNLDARVVVFEEFNLALIESYLASVLVATQEAERLVRLPTGQRTRLPIDTFIIATCNSYRDEPETRTRISSPTKRRSTTVTMPNVLSDLYDAQSADAVRDLAIDIITSEKEKVAKRLSSGAGSQFDAMRLERLETVTAVDDFAAQTVEGLIAVSSAILDTAAGKSWFTMGLLRDVVLHLAVAERNADAELLALGEAVADKLVHQLRGTHRDAQALLAACADLPNAAEIGNLIDRSMDGPSEELLPLV